jgi:hypothetical protein
MRRKHGHVGLVVWLQLSLLLAHVVRSRSPAFFFSGRGTWVEIETRTECTCR